jgi:hypothetical protein
LYGWFATKIDTAIWLQEYHLGNYSTWLQKQVDKDSLWDKIQICLNDAKVCNKLDNEYPTSTQFDAASLTPVQVYTCFFLSDLLPFPFGSLPGFFHEV